MWSETEYHNGRATTASQTDPIYAAMTIQGVRVSDLFLNSTDVKKEELLQLLAARVQRNVTNRKSRRKPHPDASNITTSQYGLDDRHDPEDATPPLNVLDNDNTTKPLLLKKFAPPNFLGEAYINQDNVAAVQLEWTNRVDGKEDKVVK